MAILSFLNRDLYIEKKKKKNSRTRDTKKSERLVLIMLSQKALSLISVVFFVLCSFSTPQ